MKALHVHEGVTYEHESCKEIKNLAATDVIYTRVTPVHREHTCLHTHYTHER